MNDTPTPRFDSWWNSYRSGSTSANDFKEVMRQIERENEEYHQWMHSLPYGELMRCVTNGTEEISRKALAILNGKSVK